MTGYIFEEAASMFWISIADAVPTKPGFYFTYGTEGCDYQFYKDGKWGIGHGKSVTHWMIPRIPQY